MKEAAKGGCKVEGHAQTPEGAQRAIDAGIKLRDVWEKKIPLTFSTDFDCWNERMT